MLKKERKVWAEKIREQMLANLPPAEAVVLLTRKRYYEFLMPYPEKRFVPANVKKPMEGLRIGKRLSWLKDVVSGKTSWSCKCQDFDEGIKDNRRLSWLRSADVKDILP